MSEPMHENADLRIYNDCELAQDIAYAIKPHLDRLFQIRDSYADIRANDPDATYLIVTPQLKRELGLRRANLSKPLDSTPLKVTNRQAMGALVFEAEEEVAAINSLGLAMEQEAEDCYIYDLTHHPEQLTNEQTQEIAGRALSYWKRLTADTRAEYIRACARRHPHVLGIRSESALSYMSYADRNLRPQSQFVSTADFIANEPS